MNTPDRIPASTLSMPKFDFIIMIVGAVILGISSHIALFTIGCLTISICAGLIVKQPIVNKAI
jgi:hypothetical protein